MNFDIIIFVGNFASEFFKIFKRVFLVQTIYMIRKFELSCCGEKCTGQGTIVAAVESVLRWELLLRCEVYCNGNCTGWRERRTVVGTVLAVEGSVLKWVQWWLWSYVYCGGNCCCCGVKCAAVGTVVAVE
jgi:hypothetical protein